MKLNSFKGYDMSKFKMIREALREEEMRNPLTKTILDTAEGLMEAGVMDTEVAEEIARTLTEMGGPSELLNTLRFRAQAEEEESMNNVGGEEQWTQLTPDQEEQIVDIVNMQLHRLHTGADYTPADVIPIVRDVLDDVPGLEDPEAASAIADKLGRRILKGLQGF
jgi:hypothetical protein